MTTPEAPTNPTPAEAELPPDERLKLLWDRYGSLLSYVLGAVALAILAKGGWGYVNAQKELGIQKEFQACTTPDSFLSFAAKHPGHPLAGVAEETVADNAYASGKYLDALRAYSSAASDLPAGPVRGHAKLGQAMSFEATGRTGEAEGALRALVEDPSEMKAIRCEAGYHLAGMMLAAGRTDDVQKISEELIKIDAENPFAERTFVLRATAAGPAAPEAPGTISVPGR